jgi:hypothetical protein
MPGAVRFSAFVVAAARPPGTFKVVIIPDVG